MCMHVQLIFVRGRSLCVHPYSVVGVVLCKAGFACQPLPSCYRATVHFIAQSHTLVIQ